MMHQITKSNQSRAVYTAELFIDDSTCFGPFVKDHDEASGVAMGWGRVGKVQGPPSS